MLHTWIVLRLDIVYMLVEYASTVWNPYTKTEINKIEAVQRRAAKYVVNNHRNRSSVSNMLQRLKWKPLANRRKDARLMMMYKIDRELLSITKENRLIPPCRRPRNTHNRAFQIESCRIDTTRSRRFRIEFGIPNEIIRKYSETAWKVGLNHF